MERENEIVEELKIVAPALLAAERVAPFHVPQHYFRDLAGSVLSAISESPVIPVGIADPFIVPLHYFDELPGIVIGKIQAIESVEQDDLASVAPVLASLKKENVYAVPGGYFDQKPLQVPSQAKVVPIKWHKKLVQYVAAAMLAGVLVTGAFMYTDSKAYNDDVEKAARPDYPSYRQAGPREEVVINPLEKASSAVQLSNPVKRNPNFARKVESLSDAELQNYLDENASSESLQLNEEATEI